MRDMKTIEVIEAVVWDVGGVLQKSSGDERTHRYKTPEKLRDALYDASKGFRQ